MCSGSSGGWGRYENETRKAGCKWKPKRSVEAVNNKSDSGFGLLVAPPPVSRIVVQYLESLQPIRSEPLASIPRHPSNKICLSEGPVSSPTNSSVDTSKPSANKPNLLAGGNCVLQLQGTVFAFQLCFSSAGKMWRNIGLDKLKILLLG